MGACAFVASSGSGSGNSAAPFACAIDASGNCYWLRLQQQQQQPQPQPQQHLYAPASGARDSGALVLSFPLCAPQWGCHDSVGSALQEAGMLRA